MTTLDLNYGPLQRPEERKNIRSSQNIFASVMAAFQQWLPVAERIGDWHNLRNENDYSKADELYHEAESLLRPIGAIESMGADGLLKLVKEIESAKASDSSGFFASALHNLSGAKELKGVFKIPVMGYRLEANKALVLLRGSSLQRAGQFGKGVIYNYGVLRESQRYFLCEFGYKASAGNYVNFGKGGWIGGHATGGLFINMNDASALGNDAIGGTFVNCGSTTMIAHYSAGGFSVNYLEVEENYANDSRNGVHVNLGHVTSYMGDGAGGGLLIGFGLIGDYLARDAYGGLQINFTDGDVIDFEEQGPIEVADSIRIDYPGFNHKSNLRSKKRQAVKAKLDEMLALLAELKPVGAPQPDKEEMARTILQYDWGKVDTRLAGLGKDIEAMLR